MKKIFLLIILFSIQGFSQKNGKIYFRNGEVFEGRIEIDKPIGTEDRTARIHYYPSKNTRLTKGFSEIYKVEDYQLKSKDSDTITFYFKKFKNKELLLTKLYTYQKFDVFKGFYTIGVSSLVPGFSETTTGLKAFEDFYVGKKTSDKIDKLPRRVYSRKFKNQLLSYASDCRNGEKLIDKYQKNRKLKKRELFEELLSACK